jgi:hypothetical protein
MTFHKLWLKKMDANRTGTDKVLYDLTLISYYEGNINAVEWGYNRDKEDLPRQRGSSIGELRAALHPQ